MKYATLQKYFQSHFFSRYQVRYSALGTELGDINPGNREPPL